MSVAWDNSTYLWVGQVFAMIIISIIVILITTSIIMIIFVIMFLFTIIGCGDGIFSEQ